MKRLIPLLFLALSTCGTPAAAHEEPNKVIVYDSDHRRIGTIAPNPNGKALVMRNNDNQITGYMDGARIYNSDHLRIGTVSPAPSTVGKHWK